MTSDVIAVDGETNLQRVLELMIKHRVKSLPVVRSGRHLVGIVAREDVMRAMERTALQHYPPVIPFRDGVMSSFGLDRIFAPRRVAIVGGSRRPSSIGALVLQNIAKLRICRRDRGGQPKYGAIDGVNDLSRPGVVAVCTRFDRGYCTRRDDTRDHRRRGCTRRGRGRDHLVRSWPRPGFDRRNGRESRPGPRVAGRRAELLRSDVPRHCVECQLRGAASQTRFAGVDFAIRGDRSGDGRLGRGASVGFSGIVSIGDQLDVDIPDLLDYFALDDKTSAILLYLEAVTDARKFMSAARAAARLKPVVVVKSGRMAQGAKAAATHTGALAGSDAVYEAAFRRAGLLRVFDLRELFDCAELLARHVQGPAGSRLAILTNGGGLGILAVDRLTELGGAVPALTPAAAAKLDAVLPPTWSKSNPVDISGDADESRYVAALDVLLADPSSDAVLVMNVETAVASAPGSPKRLRIG